MSRAPVRGLALAALALLPLAAVMGEGPARAGEDLDEIRELHRRGEIQSLEAILEQARRVVPEGRLVEAELQHHGGRLVYEVELIDPEGVLRELYFDARTGEPAVDPGEEEEGHR